MTPQDTERMKQTSKNSENKIGIRKRSVKVVCLISLEKTRIHKTYENESI